MSYLVVDYSVSLNYQFASLLLILKNTLPILGPPCRPPGLLSYPHLPYPFFALISAFYGVIHIKHAFYNTNYYFLFIII